MDILDLTFVVMVLPPLVCLLAAVVVTFASIRDRADAVQMIEEGSKDLTAVGFGRNGRPLTTENGVPVSSIGEFICIISAIRNDSLKSSELRKANERELDTLLKLNDGIVHRISDANNGIDYECIELAYCRLVAQYLPSCEESLAIPDKGNKSKSSAYWGDSARLGF